MTTQNIETLFTGNISIEYRQFYVDFDVDNDENYYEEDEEYDDFLDIRHLS